MAKVTKLRRNDVDKMLDEVAALGLTEVMVIGKASDGDVISYISENTTCETLAMGGLMINRAATDCLLDED